MNKQLSLAVFLVIVTIFSLSSQVVATESLSSIVFPHIESIVPATVNIRYYDNEEAELGLLLFVEGFVLDVDKGVMLLEPLGSESDSLEGKYLSFHDLITKNKEVWFELEIVGFCLPRQKFSSQLFSMAIIQAWAHWSDRIELSTNINNQFFSTGMSEFNSLQGQESRFFSDFTSTQRDSKTFTSSSGYLEEHNLSQKSVSNSSIERVLADEENLRSATPFDEISVSLSFNGSTSVEDGPFYIRNSSGEAWLNIFRGENQHGGIAFQEKETARTQWFFPYFRGWQSDNLIIRDEIANKDVVTFEAATGKVGIGISTPESLLDVNGSGRIRGEFTVDEGVTFSDGIQQTAAATPSWHQIIQGTERFELVMNDEAVLDRETGLVWERNTSDTMYNWYEAQSHCYVLELGGRKGWRLPTIDELATVVGSSEELPSLPNNHPFTGAQLDIYWSSTTDASEAGNAWRVDFYGGNVGVSAKSLTRYIRAVRSGQKS